MDRAASFRICYTGYGIVFVLALLGGLVGAAWGWKRMHDPDLGQWVPFAESYGVKDIPHFVWVGFIHNCSYAGGLLGLIVSLIYARRKVARHAALGSQESSPADQQVAAHRPQQT